MSELTATQAERRRAQEACEQMGKRITKLEQTLEILIAAYAFGGLSHELWEHAAKELGWQDAKAAIAKAKGE